MTSRRTYKGSMIDMEALAAQSPSKIPAVGNMGVNAKGDKLGKNGKVVQKNEDRVRAHYKNNPSTTQTGSLRGTVSETVKKHKPMVDEFVDPEPEEKPKPTTKRKSKTKTQEPPQPLGYVEVENDEGDIDMVPYFSEEEADVIRAGNS